MPHSLRAKLSGLRYKGILEDKDYKRLCKALDNEKVLDKISDEILFIAEKCLPNCTAEEYEVKGLKEALNIIDKYREERGI